MRLFSIREVKRLLSAPDGVVEKWINSGKLPTCSASNCDTCVSREELIRLLKGHNFPAETATNTTTTGIVVVTKNDDLMKSLCERLTLENGFLLARAHNAFEAGVQANCVEAVCILVDFASLVDGGLGWGMAKSICDEIASTSWFGDVLVLALLKEGYGSTSSYGIESLSRSNIEAIVDRLEKPILV